MTSSLILVDGLRKQRRISQATIASALGVTQGHYSKALRGIVPLSNALRLRAEEWLAANGPLPADTEALVQILDLAAEIQERCMKIMHLSRTIDRVVDRTN